MYYFCVLAKQNTTEVEVPTSCASVAAHFSSAGTCLPRLAVI